MPPTFTTVTRLYDQQQQKMPPHWNHWQQRMQQHVIATAIPMKMGLAQPKTHLQFGVSIISHALSPSHAELNCLNEPQLISQYRLMFHGKTIAMPDREKSPGQY